MRLASALIVMALGAGVAGAQIVPLGAPIFQQPKTKAAPPPSSQDLTGRLKPAGALGSNYSPYSVQPQAAVTAAAPSALPGEKPVASGIVNDPNAPPPTLGDPGKIAKPSTPKQQSDLQKLGPQGPERTEMPAAETPDPH